MCSSNLRLPFFALFLANPGHFFLTFLSRYMQTVPALHAHDRGVNRNTENKSGLAFHRHLQRRHDWTRRGPLGSAARHQRQQAPPEAVLQRGHVQLFHCGLGFPKRYPVERQAIGQLQAGERTSGGTARQQTAAGFHHFAVSCARGQSDVRELRARAFNRGT